MLMNAPSNVGYLRVGAMYKSLAEYPAFTYEYVPGSIVCSCSYDMHTKYTLYIRIGMLTNAPSKEYPACTPRALKQ